MNSKLYVGNLSYNLQEQSLKDVFAEFGEVRSAKIIMDRDSGNSKGFGFVEMGSNDEAQLAIDNLDGKEVDGRNIRVSIAKEKQGGARGGSRPQRNFNR
ncbi:MAG: RNA-binding protein [Halobacteriovoraceae bacterium]|nr:RNA-binding protein [Halobacteriovoraceae bacterium]